MNLQRYVKIALLLTALSLNAQAANTTESSVYTSPALRQPAHFPLLNSDHLEEYQLGNLPAVILAYKNFQLGETYSLREAGGKSVLKSAKAECRFLTYSDEGAAPITLTITHFIRAQDNPKEIWIEGRLAGALPATPQFRDSEVSNTYCRKNDQIRLRAHELSELQGPSPQSLIRLQQALKNIGV